MSLSSTITRRLTYMHRTDTTHRHTDGAAVSRDLHHGAARQQIVARHADGTLLVELRREVLCHVRLVRGL